MINLPDSHCRCRTAFTLIELLVVVGIISLLLAILAPALSRARHQVRRAVCGSNIRQLALANVGYSGENHDLLVPAASDINHVGGGRHRWHGVRAFNGVAADDPQANRFDPLKGPLAGYLFDGAVKECPGFRPAAVEEDPSAFEFGTGGYGYNIRGVGSQNYLRCAGDPFELAMTTGQIRRPSDTIMFTDAAMPRGFPQQHLIEYSFAQAPLWVFDSGGGPEVMSGFFADPSIHFRHLSEANGVWCDGHVSSEALSWTKPRNVYGGDNEAFEVGWFGPEDNSLFDPY